MNAGTHHAPIDAKVTPRFAGVRTFMRAPHVTDLDGVDAVAVGIPFDTGTSYRPGARFGPEAVRSASALLRPFHQGLKIHVTDELSVVDYGDVPVAPGDVEGTYARAEEALRPVVDAGVFPLVLGGDHSITLAELRTLVPKFGPLCLVQFDSHTDTSDNYFGQRYFHGTTFRRAVEEGLLEPSRSIQAGIRGSIYGADDINESRDLGFNVFEVEELRELGPQRFGEFVRSTIGPRAVFVSFDIDFLDPAYAPGTGTPEVGGFSTAEALAFLRTLAGANLVGCDVVEVSPPYDSPGQPTALAAANIAFDLLALRALATRQSREGDDRAK